MNRGSNGRTTRSSTISTGFNEAPIHESGKPDSREVIVRYLEEASMRPRFMNRGSASRKVLFARCSSASMRPRFMNRGSNHRIPRQPRRARASMRPRFMNRGSRITVDDSLRRRCASMRPRFMNRGSARIQAIERACNCASMRPRFMNRGSAIRSRSIRSFSIRFNEAPIHESGKLACHPVRSPALLGFNEAPIHESGKRHAYRSLRCAWGAASMRPRFMNRGSVSVALDLGGFGERLQ